MQRFEKTIGENLILLEFLYSAKISLKCEGKKFEDFSSTYKIRKYTPNTHFFLIEFKWFLFPLLKEDKKLRKSKTSYPKLREHLKEQ